MNLYTQLKYQKNIVKPIILDLGANVGIEGEKLYNLYPGGKLIFVEPMFDNAISLYELIKQKNMAGKWFVENCAIDVNSGFADIMFEKSPHMYGRPSTALDPFNWKTWNYSFYETVRTKTINEICKKPDMVKVDIERHEYVILPDLAAVPSVKVVFLELHGPCYELDVSRFLEINLENTGLEVTGWYQSNQSQTSSEDNAVPCEPMQTIQCGDYRCVVLERKC